MPAADDAVVRNIPLLVRIGGYVTPGFSLETIRVARNASVYLIQAAPPSIATTDIKVPSFIAGN